MNHDTHEEKGRVYRKRGKKISVMLYGIILMYTITCITYMQFGETYICILQPKVLLQFACAICMGLCMHCSSHSYTLLIISSRFAYCANRESSINKYFARLCRYYHTPYCVNELKFQLSTSTGVIPLAAVLTYP